MKAILITLTAGLLAMPAAAQSIAELRTEFEQKMTASNENAAELFELAKWAREKGLIRESRNALKRVVEIEPEHEEARGMLGFVKHEGEWMTKSKARILKRRAEEAAMRAKGLEKVDGLWLPLAEVEDAKNGIFRHEGEVVSRAEKKAYMDGMVRHPDTGMFIPEADLAKAQQGLYPIPQGDQLNWVSLEEANQFHQAGIQQAWVVRGENCSVITPYTLEWCKSLTTTVDAAITELKPLFGDRDPKPQYRPVLFVATNSEQYIQLGDQFGDENSAYSAFLSAQEIEHPSLGLVTPACSNWNQNWGTYWIRHAAGLAYVHSQAAAVGAQLPQWFQRGIANRAENFFDPGIAKYFATMHIERGGVSDLATWFDNFAINGEMDYNQMMHNMFQAGLLVDFAQNGGDAEASKALQAVSAAFKEEGAAVEQAVSNLQQVLISKEAAVREYLGTLAQG